MGVEKANAADSQSTRATKRSQEAGAVLIHVAVAMLALVGLAAFAVDNGLLYVGRRQAQNAADAAALAGATAWAFDEADHHPTPDSNGYVVQSINQISGKFQIADQPTHTTTHAFGTVPDATGVCPPYLSLPNGTDCVRVNVYQNGENGSTRMPVFFSSIFGIANQGTKATATAVAAQANASNCLKPWLIPDKWTDVNMDGDFDIGVDTYTAPGWTEADIGTVTTLKPQNPSDAFGPSDFYEIDEASTYEEAITGCLLSFAIGDTVTTLPGNRKGPTAHAVGDLLVNGPVIVNIAMFSPETWAGLDRSTGTYDLEIVNIMAFKITSVQNGTGNVTGEIISGPAELRPGGPAPAGASFIKVIQLVQ
jgi:Flp pilus assembly protein TadG